MEKIKKNPLEVIKQNNKKICLIALCLAFSAILAYFLSELFSYDGFAYVKNVISGIEGSVDEFVKYYKSALFSEISRSRLDRIFIIASIVMIVLLHFIFGIKRTFHWFFDRRWLVGVIILVFFVSNKYNGDSLYSFNYDVQPSLGSEYIKPIIGVNRPIRSDEWMVSSANLIRNYTECDNIWDIPLAAIVKAPQTFISRLLYLTAGIEYTYSFDWYFAKIITILLVIEFFLIVTEKKKALSFVMAMMFIYSPFYMWWGHPGLWYAFFGSIVFFNMFFEVTGYKRYLTGLAAAYFANLFVFDLYPAWEVPLGYIAFIFLIYIIYKNINTIKNMKKTEWLQIGFSIIALFSFLCICYLHSKQYIQNVTATVYPGKRESSGGYALNKLYYYASSVFYAYKDSPNNSEFSSFITLFPLPTILIGVKVSKQEKKDVLSLGLLVVFGILFVFCSTSGMSLTIARKLMLSSSIPERTVDILGFIQLVFLARYMKDYFEKTNNDSKRITVVSKYIVGLVIGALLSLYTLHINNMYIPEYLSINKQIIIIFFITIITMFVLAGKNRIEYYIVLSILLFSSLFGGLFVRPISKGLDSLYSKPVAKEIKLIEQNNPNDIWITTESTTTQAFVSACGADVMNVVHSTPDMELWRSLDPDGTYEEVYNRYQHIVVSVVYSETSFELIQPDVIKVYISTKDLYKTSARFLYSPYEININDDYIETKLLYGESGAYIYKIDYK